VGFGGSPDEKGETTLDSLVMDGPGHKSGSVAAIRFKSFLFGICQKLFGFFE
jgi:isoaspartyl peptidase/L-asparaginase-like protein (Ntn-hydrolase superfamily)